MFYLGGIEVEIVNSFKYLRITFTKSGKFIKTIKENISKARRAFHLLMKNCKKKLIPLDCRIELFEKCIEPIMLYGCELWGIEKSDILEVFRLKCYKTILRAKASTPAYIIYCELGKLPLVCSIQKRMLSFWGNIITSDDCKLSHIMYSLLLNDMMQCGHLYKWIECVKFILNTTGNTDTWLIQNYINKFHGNRIKRTIDDIALQELKAKCTSNKGKNYLNLKENWALEAYLKILDDSEAISIFKFRTSNHRLPVET